jgi:hypothetical protein
LPARIVLNKIATVVEFTVDGKAFDINPMEALETQV